MISKKLNISLNPYQFYMLIQREYEESFLLESIEGKEKLARFSFIGFNPKKHIRAYGKVVDIEGEEQDVKEPIKALAKEIPKIKIEKEGFTGGAVGYFSYDYVRNVEKIPEITKPNLDFPDFEFGIFEDCIIFDHRDRSVNYLSHTEDRSDELISLSKEDRFFGPFESGVPRANIGKEKFEEMVANAKEHIINGDIFQVVLSRRYELPFEGNILRFYNFLKQINPSPYMYFLSFGDRKIVGSSPENLVRVEGRKIDSYATLAGTRPRGNTVEEDKKLENELLTSEKEKAEHLMLVDLTRNDVGKVSKFNTVNVPELMEVHKYSHVQHLGSHVVGELADGKDCFDAFNALFPAGTISGAPKVRAMEIIEELEPERRGPYGGSVGYFSFNGNCDFAISIRTLFAKRQKAYVQAGAGIVYDSIPEKEYCETENKMKALINALEGGMI
ncbi:anthranilate synthase component I [Candidatus Micrarchaeota archaeon]|nr:anthranilate synthase component I [Candidatus Micrarchaeota archaeon]